MKPSTLLVGLSLLCYSNSKNKAVVGGNAFSHSLGFTPRWSLKSSLPMKSSHLNWWLLRNNSLPLGKLSGRHAFVEKLHELGLGVQKKISSHCLQVQISGRQETRRSQYPISAPLLPVQQWKNPGRIPINAIRPTAIQTITGSWPHCEEGEVLEFPCQWSGSLKRSLMRLINSSTKLFAWHLIIYRCSDWWDRCPSPWYCTSVENVDTDTIFNASGLDFWRIESLCHCLYQCQRFQFKRECGWDGTSYLPTVPSTSLRGNEHDKN